MSAAVPAPQNGLPSRLPEVHESLEYGKILNIYRQVTDGSYQKRLKTAVSQAPVPSQPQLSRAPQPPQKTAPSVPLPVPSFNHPVLPPAPAPPAHQLPGLHLSSSVPDLAPTYKSLHGSSFQRSTPTKAPVSELDPIFLTKADALVRAEIQLQRRRAERTLREQSEQKKADARHKPSLAEAKPDFDVAEVLTQAMALVKPEVIDAPNAAHENASASDSFDENSFYSSKAPDSSSRDEDDSRKSPLAKAQDHPVHHDELEADVLVDRHADSEQQAEHNHSPYNIIPRPPFPTASNQVPRIEAERRQETGLNTGRGPVFDDEDEPEYSPPEPAQLSFSRDGHPAIQEERYLQRSRPAAKWQQRQSLNARDYDSPPDTDVRIVRSHITSPNAPQPQRVSPLAVARGPPISQNRRRQQDQPFQQHFAGGSERTSPEVTAVTNQPRKRRKVQEGKRAARRRGVGSPVIKDEPVSPPPFHDIPPLGSIRQRQTMDRPIYIDSEPAQEIRYVQEMRPELTPRRAIYDLDEPAPHSAPRVLSRAAFRDIPKYDTDLRKVASLQQLSSKEYAEPPRSVRVSRAPSFSFAEEVSRPMDKHSQTSDRPRNIQERLPPPSPAPRHDEYDHIYAQPMAPPPQRRILLDEFGSRIYENSERPRASAAPPMRAQDVIEYNERSRTRNGATARSVSVFEEPQRETRYVDEMRPPHVVYRRIAENPRPARSEIRYITEAPRSAASEIRYITQEPLDSQQGHRSGSVQVYDFEDRQPAFSDDRHHRGEPVMRVSSVRPGASRYEEPIMRVSSVRPSTSRYAEPTETYQRVQSVRPEARGSTRFHDDESQIIGREAGPAPGPLYEVRQSGQGERYYRVDTAGGMLEERRVMPGNMTEWY